MKRAYGASPSQASSTLRLPLRTALSWAARMLFAAPFSAAVSSCSVKRMASGCHAPRSTPAFDTDRGTAQVAMSGYGRLRWASLAA